MENLSNEEIEERVAILKRLKTLLEQQRNKFKEYLNVLEKQQNSIDAEDSEALIKHSELEQQIASNIISLQKVIKPIEVMCNDTFSGVPDLGEIPQLQADLQNLQQQVLDRNKKNRDLLQVHIGQLKDRLSSMKNPYRNARSVYAQSSGVATRINISI